MNMSVTDSEWRDIYEEIVHFIFHMNHEFRQLAVTIYNNM